MSPSRYSVIAEQALQVRLSDRAKPLSVAISAPITRSCKCRFVSLAKLMDNIAVWDCGTRTAPDVES